MQYQIPQFIEIEDKVVGPLTFRQFVYVAGAVGAAVVFYLWLPFLVALPLIAVMLGLGGTLAFYKINNKPFAHFIESALKYSVGSRLYVWKKELKKPTAKKAEEKSMSSELYIPKLSDSKLRDIAWSLDVHEQEQGPVHERNLEA